MWSVWGEFLRRVRKTRETCGGRQTLKGEGQDVTPNPFSARTLNFWYRGDRTDKSDGRAACMVYHVIPAILWERPRPFAYSLIGGGMEIRGRFRDRQRYMKRVEHWTQCKYETGRKGGDEDRNMYEKRKKRETWMGEWLYGNEDQGPRKIKSKEQGVRKRWPIYPTEGRLVSRRTCPFPSTALYDVRKSWCSSGGGIKDRDITVRVALPW